MDGNKLAVACDQWMKVCDNAREIALYICEKCKMEDRPVATGQSEFATARLSPRPWTRSRRRRPAPTTSSRARPHEILKVSPDASEDIVQTAFKAQVRDLEGHPDYGGTSTRFRKLEEDVVDNERVKRAWIRRVQERDTLFECQQLTDAAAAILLLCRNVHYSWQFLLVAL